MPSASRSGLIAANALSIAVVADSVPVLIAVGAVFFTVVTVISAFVADTVAVIVAVGAVLGAVINYFDLSIVTVSSAVMSAVSGYGHACRQNG